MNISNVETLRDLFLTATREHATRPALSFVDGSPYRYEDVGRAVGELIQTLRERGIGPGDRVVLFAENSPEWGITYLAVTASGAVIVPLLTDFHPDQVARIIAHAEPALIVTSPSMQKLVEQAGTAVPLVTLGELVPPPPDSAGSADAGLPNGESQPPAPAFETEIGPDDRAAIIYTSGTTGNPKGVVLSHGNLASNVVNTLRMVPVYSRDRLLSILPLAHTYECTIGFLIPFLSGAFVNYIKGPPVISALLPALRKIRPTMMLSVPLIMEKIYRSRVAPVLGKLPGWLQGFAPARKLIHRLAAGKVKKLFGGKLRFFGIGGAALSEDTERFLREGHFPYAIGYGLTETSPLIAGADAKRTRFRSGGHAVPGTELRIAHDEEADTSAPPQGEALGEIQARGPSVMQGYYRNPEATAAAFTSDGWFRTGDLGTIDRRGYVYIRGRSKTTIIGPSGENIFPEEIEAAINADEVVEESLVTTESGNLVARVRLNAEKLAERLGHPLQSVDLHAMWEHAEHFLDDLRKQVNARVNRFSRVAKMKLQVEPFERTPTKKIKRFRYGENAGTERESDSGGEDSRGNDSDADSSSSGRSPGQSND